MSGEVQPAASDSDTPRISPLEMLRTFLIFGLIGFGGPAAHIALMQRELVERRKWIRNDQFLDMLAAVNLVPGPNSTEMAFHIGLTRGGLIGQIMAAIGFVLPAVLLSTLAAAIYVAYGSLPAVQGILLGVKPVILVLIASAAYRLGRQALDNRPMRILFGGAMGITALGVVPIMAMFGRGVTYVPELAILLATGALYVIWRRRLTAALATPMLPFFGLVGAGLAALKPTALDLFARFAVIGATLFGSGYVLAAYMDRMFVTDTGWLSPGQLVDTLAIGQSTPGPVLSTAAAAGFVMTATPDNLAAGILPAFASAVGVFTPAFLIVLLLGRVIPVIRRSATARDFLKGVNAGVIALLVATFINLAWGTLIRPGGALDWLSVTLTGLAFYALERRNWTPLTLVLAGMGIGLLRAGLGWM